MNIIIIMREWLRRRCWPIGGALGIIFAANVLAALGGGLPLSLLFGAGNVLLAYGLLVPLLRERERVARRLLRSEGRAQQGYQDMLQFAYIAAHDLQSPLATISGFAGLFQEEYGAGLDENGRRYLQFLEEESQAASRKVEGLLQFSRVETQGKTFVLVPVKPLVERAAVSLRAELAAAGGGRIEIGSLPTVVTADGGQLEWVFLNLMGNAIKYRHPERTLRLRVSARGSAGEMVFCVADNGQGIPDGYEAKVFTIFGRLHDSQTPGDGIGLAVVKRIVERHGGRVWFESGSEGSRFYFSIPR